MENKDFVIQDGVLTKYKGSGGDVTIPERVTIIGDWVFSGCTGLTSVTIPEGVRIIGLRDFEDCVNLTSVTIPEGVTEICSGGFIGCTALTSISIAKSISDISRSVFWDTPWLKNLGEFAVVNGILLAYQGAGGDVTIPAGVKKIGEEAFWGCKGLTSVTIPKGVNWIGNGAFRGCKGLTSVTIPESVMAIGNWAFSDCTGLTSVTILEGITWIGECAFEGCTGLTSLTIPESVNRIIDNAFCGCEGLTSVTIPKSVTRILETLFDASRPAIIAPHIPIASFAVVDKPGACTGFAKAYLDGAEMDEEIKAGYLKYIKRRKKYLYPLAVQREELLRLMFAEKMLSRKDIDPLLEECDKQNNIAAKAAVLDYVGRNLKPVDPLKEFKLKDL